MMGNSFWVNDCSSGGSYIYLVMRGHEVYAELVSKSRLSWSEQADIAAGYTEAYANYTPSQDLTEL